MTWNPGFRHERTFLNSTAIWSLIKSSCLLHVLQNHGIFCLMYSVCRFPVVRLLTVVYFSMCNVCWAAAWGMVGFLWGRKEPCPSIETAVAMSQGLWYRTDTVKCGHIGAWSMHSVDRVVLMPSPLRGMDAASCPLVCLGAAQKLMPRCKHSSERIGMT